MFFAVLLLGLGHSELCVPVQVGDDHCDPACMTAFHSFDAVFPGVSDCTDLCTCPQALRNNGLCDEECRSWECEWDSGDCGECVAGCSTSKLGNGLCDPECNAADCNWDAGECVTAASPAEYFVDSVQNALFEVLRNCWSPWNRVWLVREFVPLHADSRFAVLMGQPGLVETTIATLLCLDRSVPGCLANYSTIQLTALHPLFRVTHSVTFRHVRFSGNFRLQDEFPDTYCPFTEQVEGEWLNDKNEVVTPTVNQSVCAEYSTHSFFLVESGGVLALEDVKFEGFRQQLKAIIGIECGEVRLHRVDFVNSMAAQTGGGLIVQESKSTNLCGSLEYMEGSVRLLNNGYEYRDTMALSGFLVSDKASNTTISRILFEYNFLGSADTSLISLTDFGVFTAEYCTFQWNMGGMSTGFDLRSTLLNQGIGVVEETNDHIKFSNLTFYNNTSLGCTCLCVYFQDAHRNVKLSTLVLNNNYSPQGTLINISAKAVSVLEGSGGLSFGTYIPPKYVNITDITATDTHGQGFLTVSKLGNVFFDSSNIKTSSGSNIVTVPLAFIQNPDSYIKTTQSYQQIADCVQTLSFSDIYSLRIANIAVTGVNCPLGKTGIALFGSFPLVVTRQALSITSCNFTQNIGPGAISIRTHTPVSLSFIQCSNNQNFEDGGSPCVDISMQSPSEVIISDSQFSQNAALSASAVLASGTQSLVITRVHVLKNSAKASCGGVLVSPIPTVASVVMVRDSEFAGNSADSFGALAVIDLAGVLMGNRVGILRLLVEGCTFTDNITSSQGSSITVYKFVQLSQNSLVTRSTFTKNSSNRGPGVYCEYESGVITVSACLFTKNISLKGSAILAHHYPPGDLPSMVIVSDCVFTLNSGSPAIAIDGWELPAIVQTANNLYDRNSGGAVASSTGTLTDRNSVYVGNTIKSSGVIKLTSSNATMHNCSWRDNVGRRNGGVFFLSGRSALEVQSSHIINNSAAGIGGVVYADEMSTARFANSEILRNAAGKDGAFAYVLASSIHVENCTIRNNSAGHSFLVVISEGAGEFQNSEISNNIALADCSLSASFSTLTIANCSFSAQRAQQGAFVHSGKDSRIEVLSSSFAGGFASLQGGAIYCVMGCELAVRLTLFERCSSEHEGGAVFLESANSVIEGTRLQSIESGPNGGAINFHSGTAVLRRCVFNDTKGAALLGMHVAALSVSDSAFSRGDNSRGGLLYCSQCSQLNISSSNFSAGRSYSGGAVYIDAPRSGEYSCEIVNSSFIDNHATFGGGLNIEGVNCSLSGNTIADNSVQSGTGGGLNIACDSDRNCEYWITGNEYRNNSADIQGGAVNLQTKRSPHFAGNTFEGNSAYYGNDIASAATIIAAMNEDDRLSTKENGLHFADVVSGEVYTREIILGLFDNIGQLVKTADSLLAEITVPNNSDVLLGGDIKASSVQGVFHFRNFQLIAQPGSTQSALIEVSGLPPLPLTLSFRNCAVGESLQNQQCLTCPANTYSLDPLKPCFMCPNEAICYGNYSMVPKSGYWRPSNSTTQFFKCFNPKACTGSSATPPLSLTGDCAVGYAGNLCQSCAESYSRNGKHKCSSCPSTSLNATLTLVMFLAVLIALGLLIYFTIANAMKPKSLTAVHLKIMINYTQLVVIVTSVNIRWPTFINGLIVRQDKVGSATEQLSSYLCLANEMGYTEPSVYLTSNLAAITPAFLIVVTSLCWVLLSRCKRVEFLREKLLCSWILALFTVHPTLTSDMLAMFACVEVEPGQYWLITEMSVSCWGNAHTRELLTVVVPSLVVWVLGLPLMALGWLVSARRRLALRQTALLMGFMYRGYEVSSYYWEFVILVRKVVAITVMVALGTQTVQLQALAILACLLLFFFLQLQKKPFLQAQLNSLETKSILVSIVTIYAGLYFIWQELGKRHTDFVTSMCLFVILVIANAFFLLAWLSAAGAAFFQSLKELVSRVWRKKYEIRPVQQVDTAEEEQRERVTGSLNIQAPHPTTLHESSHSSPQ